MPLFYMKTVTYVSSHLLPMLLLCTTIQVNALTPAQAETVMALIGETRDVARTDPALQEIVLDELDYYLAGAHTAEETAANIQSRASVYVAERST